MIDALLKAGATFGPLTFMHDLDEDGKAILRWFMPVEGVKFNPRYAVMQNSFRMGIEAPLERDDYKGAGKALSWDE